MVRREPKKSLIGWIKSLFASESTVQDTVAVKCDLCRDISGGPACVHHCPTGAAVRLTPPQYKQVLEQMVVSRGAR
jgi:Fe-S-cluster-containing hydrogenase component 2